VFLPFLFPATLHPLGRHGPAGRVEVDLLPLGGAQRARPAGRCRA
jgi:hypothetical protein